MRKTILDLIQAYDVSIDGLKDLFVLEMIDAGRKIISKHHPHREVEFFSQAMEIVTCIEMEGAKNGRLFPGIIEMFLALRKKRIKTGIVTRNCREAVLTLFPDIHQYCGAVITRELTDRVKPHPDHVTQALETLESPSHRSAMVGDHPMDIHAGRQAGTYTVGVLSGYAGWELLAQSRPDLIIETAATITDHLL